ncbi:hypothetical protein [Leptospira noguchii]|uniref:hypothetical protein n=1 Tax=Leptospira noguchii TaxID=28182 RepID=UPI001FB5DDB0|nr:hypothetical protein [Leptospira noguchii]UOG31866.1 hypothetical protein MAL06_07720 [Leptospira noguchii]
MPILREAFAEFPGSRFRSVDRSRLNSAERSLWITFYIKTKDNYCITFPIYNLLIRVESPVAATDNRIRPDLLTSNSYYLKE